MLKEGIPAHCLPLNDFVAISVDFNHQGPRRRLGNGLPLRLLKLDLKLKGRMGLHVLWSVLGPRLDVPCRA